MTQRYKVTLALLGALLSVFGSSTATAAAPPPKVVFLGDYLTYNWTSGFAANKNWINESRPGMNYPGELSADAVARFQADVVNLHPAIVHILVGAVDAAIADDESAPIVVANFIANIKNMVAQAKAADIKVILATTPAGAPNNFGIIQMNAFLESYGAANNIPVINYDDMLCGCVSSVGGSGIGNIYVPEPTGVRPTLRSMWPDTPDGPVANPHGCRIRQDDRDGGSNDSLALRCEADLRLVGQCRTGGCQHRGQLQHG